MRTLRTLGLICALVPTLATGAPVVLSDALTYAGSTATFSNWGNGVSATGLVGNPAAGSSAQSFTGTSSASASTDIDRGSNANAGGWVDWAYDFLINEPGIGDIRVNFVYGISDSVYSNLSASSTSAAGLWDLKATISRAAFSQTITFDNLSDASSCDSSWPGDCGTHTFSQTRNVTKDLSYASGYPVGSLLRISGSTYATARADTYVGSAESSGSAWATFSVSAVPLPSTLSLVVLSMVLLGGACRHRRHQSLHSEAPRR